MLQVTVRRPNTIGLTYSGRFETYTNFEHFLEIYVENKADNGWQATEASGSTSKEGSIELVHERHADVILIEWRTVNE